MKKIIAFVLCLITTISISGCGKTTTWNGITAELGNLQMVVDFTNMNEYVGLADYVFVGTIEEVVNNVLPDKMKKHEDGYSTYRIHVDENLKGNLVEEIICSKLGGLKKDGTM